MFQSRWERFTLIPINHFYSSPSTLVFCGCELKKADGWLSIFSWSLFKREDSCGLCHSGDFTTHTLSWLPSPSSSSLMKFATICCRAVFFVLEATLMRLIKSLKVGQTTVFCHAQVYRFLIFRQVLCLLVLDLHWILLRGFFSFLHVSRKRLV